MFLSKNGIACSNTSCNTPEDLNFQHYLEAQISHCVIFHGKISLNLSTEIKISTGKSTTYIVVDIFATNM